jgi:signal transduction histidine kinase
MSKLQKWPFRPVHITNDGDVSGKAKLTGEGILPNKLMNAHQTAMSVSFGQPTTVIEFAPFAEKTPLDSRVCVRTDSPVLNLVISPMCKEFRKWTDCKACHDCDKIHARLLSGLTRGEVLTKGPERAIQERPAQRCEVQATRPITFDSINERPYLWYNCPFLGYRELIFPIFFGLENNGDGMKDKVLAAYFVGQLCLESEMGSIKGRQTRFFGSSAGLLTAAGDSRAPDQVGGTISRLHDDWVSPENNNVLTEPKYRALIANICAGLDDFEGVLQDQITLQQDEYVREGVNRTLRHFDDNLVQELSSKRLDGLDALWKNIEKSMDLLIASFNIQYTVVFGRSQISTEDSTVLPIVAKSGNLPPEMEQPAGPITFDLSKLPKSSLARHGATPRDAELVDGLRGVAFDDSAMRLRYIPVHHPQDASAMVILFKYGPGNSPSLKVNDVEGYLNSTLRSFYSVVESSVEAFVEAANMGNVVRVFGHEAAQLTAGLDWLRAAYLGNTHIIRGLSSKKLEDIQRDMDGYVRQLMLLTSNPRAILTRPKVHASVFQPFKELLFKWKDVYRQQALVKSLQFHLPLISADDSTRPEMRADKALLEQLLYNLVGNAVKYCHPGTKIYMDCEKPSSRAGSPYILTIRDYGIMIEDDRRIYDLYYRGNSKEEGVGIGMFVAKQIAEAHQGTITHTRREVSRYNVPLLAPYSKLEPRYQESGLASRIADEIRRLRQNGDDGRVVAVDENLAPLYNPVRLKILGEIRNPTYEVIFTVTIPQGG